MLFFCLFMLKEGSFMKLCRGFNKEIRKGSHQNILLNKRVSLVVDI